jgi:DNA replication and repair protein RecF
MTPLSVDTLALTHFKNYSFAKFQFGQGFNLIYGLNGTGKTNLLDAIYYLCVGKSFFTPFDIKVVQTGKASFRLEAAITKGQEKHGIIMKVLPGEKKEILIDGVAAERVSDHLGFIPVVISAPKDIDLVSASSTYRRRYIDHLLCQISREYLNALVTYNHLLQMRNAALKNDLRDLRRIVQTYDDQMLPLNNMIFEKRKWLLEIMIPLLQENYSKLSDNREIVNAHYQSGLHQSDYIKLVDQNWEMDKKLRRSHSGIHRDDISFTVKDLPAKEYGSQGQIKSFIFSLHLSKYEVLRKESGYKPLLILDDIFDKLDESRLNRLMEILIYEEYGQVFLSDTSRKRVGNFVPAHLLSEIHMEE